jgi:hypothetical protein
MSAGWLGAGNPRWPIDGLITVMDELAETAQQFIARKSAEWEAERNRGHVLRMKDIGQQGSHLYRRQAWTFMPQTNYEPGVLVLERLDHFDAEGEVAVPVTLPAIEYRLSYWIIGRIGKSAGKWIFGQFSPIMTAGDLELLVAKAQVDGTLMQADAQQSVA